MTSSQSFDVLIVGAGLSGIGLACHLRRNCPDKQLAILESRDASGGTWDLFRFPGIRSDSDMFTLGYKFRPWTGDQDIADGESILNYIRETAAEYDVDQDIRYAHDVRQVTWSSDDPQWIVESFDRKRQQHVRYRCKMLLMCTGYYSYESGHTPDFVGRSDFQGPVLHPQQWPEEVELAGKKVVVIGSGATAVTLVPALAKRAEHVVMLQRSPSYILSRPKLSRVSKLLRKLLPQKMSYAITRWWNIRLSTFLYRRCREQPDQARAMLLDAVKEQLDGKHDVEPHFSPSYQPWDQRLCLVPDGDLFESIRDGRASVVTGNIDRFTHSGIRLDSSQEIAADVIITATGLEMKLLGGIEVVVDGRNVNFADTFTYKGMMYSDVPNLVTTFGYVNASWTLRADLTAEFICRLIQHMDKVGAVSVTPRLRDSDGDMESRPFITNFSSNYIQRAMHRMPKQGDRVPWVNTQDYHQDLKLIGSAPIDDGVLTFQSRD